MAFKILIGVSCLYALLQWRDMTSMIAKAILVVMCLGMAILLIPDPPTKPSILIGSIVFGIAVLLATYYIFVEDLGSRKRTTMAMIVFPATWVLISPFFGWMIGGEAIVLVALPVLGYIWMLFTDDSYTNEFGLLSVLAMLATYQLVSTLMLWYGLKEKLPPINS